MRENGPVASLVLEDLRALKKAFSTFH